MAIGLDAAGLILVALAMAIVRGGGHLMVLGRPVSAGTPQRMLFWLCVVVVTRLIVATRVGPFGRWERHWQRLLDSIAPEPLAPPPSGRDGWRPTALAAVGMAAAVAVLLRDQLLHPMSVPDLGDPLFSMWRMGWVNHQIVRDPLHLFDTNIFYPERLTLTLSDPIILPALMIAPLLALGVHPVVAYNVLLISAFWLSGMATYLLVERLTGSPRAAFIAGLIYAFCSYRFEHYSHLELQLTQWMPLALLALHLLLSTGRWRYAVALALAGVAQLYSSMYYATFFLVFAAVIGAGLQIIHRRNMPSLLKPIAAAGAMAAILAWPLARAFTAAEPMKGERGEAEVRYYSARPADYLRVQQYSAVWRNRSWLRRPAAERTLFPGAAPVMLAAVGIAPPLGAVRLVYTAGLLASFDDSLGLNGVSYPFLFRFLSPFRGLRVPARFGAIVSLALAILAGFGVRRVLAWRPSRLYTRVMFATLVAFVMIDAWPVLTLRSVWKEPPSIYDLLKYVPNAVIAETPLLDNEVGNMPFMYFSMWHWTRMVNGYSGFVPRSYAKFREEMVFFPDTRSINELRRRGITYVSVNCGLDYENCRELMDAMRHDTRLRLTADTHWNDHTVQLYEVLAQ